jgi:flagellar protein FlgJ
MSIPVKDVSNYADFSGLDALKRSAHQNDPAALHAVAKQFESLFARMMIKSMRDAIGKDPIFGSDQSQTYQSMLDDQLSLELTKGKGLGLADMLVRQLQQSGATAAAAATGTTAASAAAATPPRATTGASSTERANFVNQIWPEAAQAAQQLGVHPVSLVAQAALETNWGRNVPRTSGGASSNNLFGVKAGSSWSGASVSAATQEFVGGAAQQTSAAFRAYASPGESFQDYVALVRNNPRLSAALGSGTSVAAFATALQQGGYATDPDYAHKMTAVAGQVLALKSAADLPIATGTRHAPGEELSHG